MNATSAQHPSVHMLALLVSGDLPVWPRWRVSRHVSECAACGQQVRDFRAGKAELRRESQEQILTSFEAIADWRSLENDMLGNIRVGLAASQCIEKVGRTRRWAMHLAWGAGMVVLFFGGWMARIPAEDNQRIVSALRRAVGLEQPQFNGTIVRSTPDGIAVRAQGATLTILHPHAAVISLSSPHSVTARYVDDDSGQVTITNVYGQ